MFKSINIYDDWDYRRFLELSKLISDDLLDWAISISNNSQNHDIIEAAELGLIYQEIYAKGILTYEIEAFTAEGECEVLYYR